MDKDLIYYNFFGYGLDNSDVERQMTNSANNVVSVGPMHS